MNKNDQDQKPCVKNETYSRRVFFEKLIWGLGALGAAMVSVPLVGFIFAPLFQKVLPIWRPVGKVGDFKVGETVSVTFVDSSPLPWAGVTAQSAAWLRRDDVNTFIAFDISCSHLGCPVRWRSEADLFMCPCHGGVYYKDGTVAAGPPPAPLSRYPTRVRDGQVELLTSPQPFKKT